MSERDCQRCGKVDVELSAEGLCVDCAIERRLEGCAPIPSAPSATVPPPPNIASDQRILDRLAAAVRGGGVVGEDRNAKLLYLGVTSRLLKEPVSEVMKGLSSSGKSQVVEAVLRFFPEEAYLKFTGMSEHALFFSEEDFEHKTIVVIEATALREGREKNEGNQTAYYIRSLLSEGEITYRITERGKEGKFVSRKITKHGPVGLILTTTAISLHGENETRMLSLPTDDGAEQTGRVLGAIARRRRRGRAAPDPREWVALQQWLAAQPAEVDVPYAEDLAAKIPEPARRAVRIRRDFNAVLGLIEAHALLHRLSRPEDWEGRVVATLEDYEVVRALVLDLISAGLGATVPQSVREVVEVVGAIGSSEGVTASSVAERLGLDKSAGRRRLLDARERGYVVNLEERRGRPGRYVLGDPMPEDVEVLPPATDLPQETAGQPSGGTVASGARDRHGGSYPENDGAPAAVETNGQGEMDPAEFVRLWNEDVRRHAQEARQEER
jgi:hypothetical protein